MSYELAVRGGPAKMEAKHRMAVTSGQGNPKWTREETILALELYFETAPSVPGPKDPRVWGLSELLRSLPYHEGKSRNETFRNPDSAASRSRIFVR